MPHHPMDSSFNTLATALGSSSNLLQQILGQVRHSYVDHGEEVSSGLSSTQRRFHGLSNDQYRGLGGRDGERSQSCRSFDPYDYERERDRARGRERDRRSNWSSSRSFDFEQDRDTRPYSTQDYRDQFSDHEPYYPRSKYEEDRRSDRLSSRPWSQDERRGETDLQDMEERSSFFGGLLEKGIRGRGGAREHPREPFWDKGQPRDMAHRREWEQRCDGPWARAASSYGFMDPMQIPSGALVRPHCYLEPPPLGMYKLPQREKPEGCRTAFVGGLPEMVDEVIMNEIFFVCGPIESIKINKTKRGETDKKYCHVRFLSPDSVDQAVLFAGYNLVIGDGQGRHKVGRFHVDYGLSKEDEREHEALKRVKTKEKRQQAIGESDNNKPTSNVFTDHEAGALLEKIRQETNIFDCLQVLEQWLEKGECSRKTASSFYSLLSSTHSHVKRLIKEKSEHEELVKKQRQEQLERARRIKDQCGAIVKVFESACKKKAWDHFTKAQRRNITTWHKQVQEEVRINEEVQIQNRVEVGMELDEDEQQSQENIEQFAGKEGKEVHKAEVKLEAEDGPPESKRAKMDTVHVDGDLEEENKGLRSQVSSLKAQVEQNSSLVWQVEGYKNEAEQFKHQYNWAIMEKNAQIAKLTAALQGLQQFLQNVDIKNPLKDTHNLQILVTNGEADTEKTVTDMDIEDAGGDRGEDMGKEKNDEDTTEEGERKDCYEAEESVEQTGNPEHLNSQDIVVKGERQETDETKATSEEERTEQEVTIDSVGIESHKSDVSDQQGNEQPENSAKATDVTKAEVTVPSDNADTDVTTSGDATKSDDVSVSGDLKSDDASVSGDLKSDDVTEPRDEDGTVADNDKVNDKEELQAEVRNSSDNWQSYYQSWNSFDWSGYSTCNNPSNAIRLSGRELAVVGVLCSFLHICPSGATEEEVAGFVQNQVKGVEKDLIRKLLTSLPMLFRAGDEKWRFCGFDSAQP